MSVRKRQAGYEFQKDRLTGDIHSEADTFTCSHGNEKVRVHPFCDPASLGGLCPKCMLFLCPKCAKKYARDGRCKTWEARVAYLETRCEQERFSDRFVSIEELNAILDDKPLR